MLACALVLLVPVAARAQATWIVNVPPESLFRWQPRTAADFAHPEVALGRLARAAVVQSPEPLASTATLDATWRELGPPARTAHVLVLDTRRHRLLLLGGLGAEDPEGSVWSCSLAGDDWSQIAVLPWPTLGVWGGSAVRAAVYDSLRDRLLVMPAGSSLALEALSLGGTPTWSHVWSGPVASSPAGIAIDTRRDALALLGVWDATASAHRIIRVPLADPTAWTSELTQGEQPVIPIRGAAIYDPSRDAFSVLFNPGYPDMLSSEAPGLYDVNASGPPTWSAIGLPPNGYLFGFVRSLALDAARDRLLLVYEYGEALALSTSGGSAQWLTPKSGSTARFGAGIVFDPVSRRLCLNGGSRTSSAGMSEVSTPVYMSATVDSGVPWTAALPVAGTVASWLVPGDLQLGSRWCTGMIADPVGQHLLLFGGYNVPGVMVRPLSGLGTWTPLGAGSGGPSPRIFGSYALYPPEDALLMYGGQNEFGGVLSDLWKLPLTPGGQMQAIQVTGTKPGGLRYASFLYDAPRSRFLLVGGDNLVSMQTNAWELRLGPVPAWRQLGVRGPVAPYQVLYADPVRGDAWCVASAVDRVRHVTISDDSLVFEIVPATGISYLDGINTCLAGFDPVHRQLLWFADRSGGYSVQLERLWITSLGGPTADWQLKVAPAPCPTGRGFMATAFDPITSRLLLDGGVIDNGSYLGDTWGLQLPVDLPTAALVSLVDATSDAAGVALRWDVDAPSGTPCTVERSTDAVAWEVAGSAQWISTNELRFAGAPLANGTRAAYRLRVGAAGSDNVSAAVWLDAPAGNLALAIRPATNPCRGIPSLRLTLASSGPARVRLQDVSGRVVGEANVAAGTQQWTSSSSVRPGLYFAEVVQGRERRVTRVVVTP
jgi:hypothetical protein